MTNSPRTSSDRILRKIEKCIALSKSSNKHEAGTALRHAQQLMEQHGINEIGIAASKIDRIAVKAAAGKTPPRWLNNLTSLINAAFGTAVVYESRSVNNGGWRSDFAFLGERSQVRIASYSFEVLQRQLVNDRSRFLANMNKRAKRLTKTRRADAYAMAWVAGAYEHIVAIKKTDDMVAAIEHFKENYYGLGPLDELSSIDRGHRSDDQKAMSQGFKAGRNARLYHGVNRERQKELSCE